MPEFDTSIDIGCRVRAWDFPHNLMMDGIAGERVRGCYVEGEVERFKLIDGIMHYDIRIERSVYEGKAYVYEPAVRNVQFPLNGTRSKGGRTNKHVVRL